MISLVFFFTMKLIIKSKTSEITYEDAFYRKDIGYRAIDREEEK